MAERQPRKFEQIVVDDTLIKRNRSGRILFALLIATMLVGGLPLLFGKVTYDWFHYRPIGVAGGLALGFFLFYKLFRKRMWVAVDLNRAFVTIDGLKAFLGLSNVYTVYGPGGHVSYPWERREETNNVVLDEASETFTVKVNTKTGIVFAHGSFRIRPRFNTQSIVAFLGGVAVIAEDLTDLIKSFITSRASAMSIREVQEGVSALNAQLAVEFVEGDGTGAEAGLSAFEERFGLVVGDVTIGQIELSKEAENTNTGIHEAEIVAIGTAKLLSYNTAEEMRGALKNGEVNQEQVNRAREHFLAVSENITMTHQSNEIRFRVDADPKLTEVISNAGPGLLALAQELAARRKGSGNGNHQGGA